MYVKCALLSAVPVVGQIASVVIEGRAKGRTLIKMKRTPESFEANILRFQGVKELENSMLIGSLFQAVVSVGLAAVLQWSVLGIGGMVLGVGFFAVALYWRWETSRYIGSETSKYHRSFQQTIRDKYTSWKSTYIQEDKKDGFVYLHSEAALSAYKKIFPERPNPDLIPEIPAFQDLYRAEKLWREKFEGCLYKSRYSRVKLEYYPGTKEVFIDFQAAMDKYLALQF